MRGKGILSAMMNMRRWVAVVVLFALMPLVFGGCYGRFPLTKKIYKWNGEMSENRWVKSIMMWVLNIIPVYGIGILADTIVFNLVEFWGGKPMLAEAATVDRNGNVVTLGPGQTADEAVLTVSRDGKVLARERFIRLSDNTIEVRGIDGKRHGKVLKASDGGYSLTNKDGVEMRRVTPEALASLASD